MLIDEIKARAQFFKRGHIIPRRILRCSQRRYQHLLRFGSDVWALPMPKGYMLLADMTDEKHSVALSLGRGFPKNPTKILVGSPYHKNGGTQWVGNYRMSDEAFEKSVIAAMQSMT